MLIQIKNWKTFERIFELDKENNTIKDTVEEALNQDVDLSYANLRGSDLRGVNLFNVNLYMADLSCADLHAADLHDSNLSGADLEFANVTDANLTDANLTSATLKHADLSGADLSGADLRDSWFDNVILDNTIMPDLPMTCPETGSFIGYKKIYNTKEYDDSDFIVKLEIQEDAKRSSSTTNKCRCSKAKVLEIRDMMSGETINEITNINEKPCTYKVGEYVYPDSFDECRWHECSHGIHFFMTEDEALDY